MLVFVILLCADHIGVFGVLGKQRSSYCQFANFLAQNDAFWPSCLFSMLYVSRTQSSLLPRKQCTQHLLVFASFRGFVVCRTSLCFLCCQQATQLLQSISCIFFFKMMHFGLVSCFPYYTCLEPKVPFCRESSAHSTCCMCSFSSVCCMRNTQKQAHQAAAECTDLSAKGSWSSWQFWCGKQENKPKCIFSKQ